PLTETVDPQRLLVGAGAQPVVEETGTESIGRLAARARRPGDAEPRTDVVVVGHVRLHFVAHPRTERQIAPHTNVVLDVQPALQVEVVDVRIADAARVAARLVRLV